MVSLLLKFSATGRTTRHGLAAALQTGSRGHGVPTCERSQFDAAGHVVVEEDPPSFAVALDDDVQRLRTDAVSCWRGRRDGHVNGHLNRPSKQAGLQSIYYRAKGQTEHLSEV